MEEETKKNIDSKDNFHEIKYKTLHTEFSKYYKFFSNLRFLR